MDHPNDRQLESLLRADHDDDEPGAAARHLDHCEVCQQRLQALAAQPELWTEAPRLKPGGGPKASAPPLAGPRQAKPLLSKAGWLSLLLIGGVSAASFAASYATWYGQRGGLTPAQEEAAVRGLITVRQEVDRMNDNLEEAAALLSGLSAQRPLDRRGGATPPDPPDPPDPPRPVAAPPDPPD